jgi:hypothetical protein
MLHFAHFAHFGGAFRATAEIGDRGGSDRLCARAIFPIALHDYPPARLRQLCRGLVVQRYRIVLFVAMSRAILSAMSTNFITYC